MRHFSGFSFGFGLITGAALLWAGLKLTVPSDDPAGASLLKGHARAGESAAGRPYTGIRDFFPQGPLSEEAFWNALPQGGARAAAPREKASEILASPRLYSRRRWFAAMLEHYQSGDLEAIHGGMMAQEKLGGRFNKEYERMMERAAEVEGAVVMDIVRGENGKPGSPVHGGLELRGQGGRGGVVERASGRQSEGRHGRTAY